MNSWILTFAVIVSLGASDLSALDDAQGADVGDLRVVTDFEGGSARVESIDQASQTIRFFPAGDPHRGWPCWWYLRVEGAKLGSNVRFELGGSPVVAQNGPMQGKVLSSNWAMPERAAVSVDGENWSQTAVGTKREGKIIYEVTVSSPTIWLAWGPPFTPKNAAQIVDHLAKGCAGVKSLELCRSREGRDVWGISVSEGDADSKSRFGVWIQARQHAWESGSSWVARGFAEWVAGNSEQAVWLRRHAEIVVIPIMDVDHVATGDGGKEAIPQDHNRDWSDAPHWPEVAAAQQRLRTWSEEGRLDVFIDLHNPGANDRRAFFYVGPEDMLAATGKRNRRRFLDLARGEITHPIALADSPKPSGPGYHPLWKQISGNWVTAHGNPHTLSVCLETSWNTSASTTDGYQAVGAQLGRAVMKYLEENPRRPATPDP